MGASNFLLGGILVAGLVTVGAELHAPSSPPTPTVSSIQPADRSSPSATISNGLGAVTIARAVDSHFYADARVNGTPVRFMIDTGASSVVLTQEDAQRLGLGGGNYDKRAIGAGGEVRLMPVTLTRLTVGPLAADAVAAMVAEQGSLPVSLLGQSFLGRFESVTIKGDEMVLR